MPRARRRLPGRGGLGVFLHVLPLGFQTGRPLCADLSPDRVAPARKTGKWPKDENLGFSPFRPRFAFSIFMRPSSDGYGDKLGSE